MERSGGDVFMRRKARERPSERCGPRRCEKIAKRERRVVRVMLRLLAPVGYAVWWGASARKWGWRP